MSQTPDITHLNDETLYELGKTIGQISAERPDITHHILLGVLSGMVNIESIHISGPRRPQYGWNISSAQEKSDYRNGNGLCLSPETLRVSGDFSFSSSITHPSCS